VRVLIADDEPIARNTMRELLAGFPDVEIVGEAVTGLEAAGAIRELAPEVALLDLQMPEMDGFSVVRSLQGQAIPLVIYVTAHDEHALEAFDTGAVDYLLKPVRPERLGAALDKARTQLAGMQTGSGDRAGDRRLEKIAGKRGRDLYRLDPNDVIAFQAEREIISVVAVQGRFYSEHTLKTLEGRLPQPPFRRVHRNSIINADHIRKISPLSSKRWVLTMSNGLEVVVSKRLADAVRDATR
jgi:DNA-binding LytR/AlgR family response regulator